MKLFKLWAVFMFLFALNIQAQDIKGIVLDKKTKQPLPGAELYIPELNKRTLTDENGRFKFTDLPWGHFTLQASFLGYDTYIVNFEISKMHSLDVEIELTPSAIETSEVVITGSITPSQHENAMKIDVIKLKPLQLVNSSFGEILSSVPGVDIIKKSGGIISPVIRGLSRTNILVLIDGFRLEDFQFSENHPFFIDDVDNGRIEIIKGPASLLYGSDAVGGVINVIPALPAPKNKTHFNANLSYHTNTSGINSSFTLKHSTKNSFWGISAGEKSHKDYKDAFGNQVLNTRYNIRELKGFVGHNFSKLNSKIYYEINRSKFGLCVAPAIPLVTGNDRKNKVFYQDLWHAFVYSKNNLPLGKNSISLNFSYEYNRRGLRVFDSLPMPIDMKLQNFNLEMKFKTYAISNLTLIFGTQNQYLTNKNIAEKGMFLPDYQVFSNAVFAYGNFKPVYGFSFQGGIRYDAKFYKIYPDPFVSPEFTTKTFSDFSASLGSVWQANNGHLTVRTNFATAYRTPNIAELAEHGLHGFRYEVGNPALKSQRSYEADFSLHMHYPAVVFDFAAFYNYLRDFIYLSPTNDTTEQGMRIYTYLQDNAVIYGFETGMNLKASKILTLKTSYSFNFGKLTNDFLPLFPQNKIKGDIIFAFNKQKYLFDLNWIYAFSQNHPSQFELPTPAYWLLNPAFSLRHKFSKTEWAFTLKITNLLNIKYIDHLSTVRDLNYYDPGRNISFGLSVKF